MANNIRTTIRKFSLHDADDSRLSIGPMVLAWISWLAEHLPLVEFNKEYQRSLWL